MSRVVQAVHRHLCGRAITSCHLAANGGASDERNQDLSQVTRQANAVNPRVV